MNCLTKSLTVLFSVIALLPPSGCASRPDTTLNPPPGSDWVTVVVTLPPETEALPLDVLYRSETCRKAVYDNTTESHVTTVRGVNPQRVSLSQAGSSGSLEARIAINGGGKCDWRLSGVRVGMQLSGASTLTKDKNVIPVDYVFDFDDEGYRNAFGHGEPKKIRGNLHLTTDFFPVIHRHRDNEVTVKLFGGDPRYEVWSRYYRVSSIHEIFIEPAIYLNKVVTITPPNSPPGDLTATYPDGSTGKVSYIYPDYKKLLLMR